jgi:protein-S-isoprenylcysteine O-methyltransferase Ste14
MSSHPPLPLASAPGIRVWNFLASGAVVAAACLAYAGQPMQHAKLDQLYGGESFSFTGMQFVVAAAALYVCLLGLHYASERVPGASKSVIFFRVILAFMRSPGPTWRRGVSREERLALLATLLKGFFGPMMAVSLMRFTMGWIDNGLAIADTTGSTSFLQIFNRHGFWFAMQVILFVDVLLFTLGYLIELPRLKNEIRSVDPTLLGWAAALLCYPPFNGLTSYVLGYQASDFPQFDNPTAHLVLNFLLLILMAAYASASVALGFRASNLTHRGIVTRGPYAVIRHPAYTCKNMAWWIGSIPLVSAAFSRSSISGVLALASVIGWSMLYVLRAVTEEDHLRSVDGEYAAYAARVRYRFIPGLI